jgi:hypothetical protein
MRSLSGDPRPPYLYLAYLEALVRKVGWIDAGRFGRQASANAVILAKHGENLG